MDASTDGLVYMSVPSPFPTTMTLSTTTVVDSVTSVPATQDASIS